MPPDPRRYDTIAPLHSISLQLLAEASSHWPGLMDALPRPVVVALVGGNASRFRFNANDARQMALQVQKWAEGAGGTVVAVTSRRTGQAATRALQSALTHPHRVYPWQPGPSANPYRALLAQADVLVVTGESETMLAEAAGTNAPLYIYPVTEIKSTRISSRFHEWGIRRAHSYFSGKGCNGDTFSPVGFIFAWMMRKGLLRPRRDMKTLHNALFACGRARPFGEPLVSAPQQPLPAEATKVAGWLVKLLKLNY
jgi:hypothetical protein